MEHAPPYSVPHKEDCGLQYQLPSHAGGRWGEERRRGGVEGGTGEAEGGGGGGVLSVIRFSGLFGGSSRSTSAHFTALNKIEEMNNEARRGEKRRKEERRVILT